MKLNIANKKDAFHICKLLNLAYRGADGWTTESALVKGNRCNENDIVADIESPNKYLLIYKTSNIIQACISVKKNEDSAYIGSFAVRPKLQNSGVGKMVLNLAEQFAMAKFQPRQFIMIVLSSRIELIEFYERRGYQRNGVIKEYPIHLNVGVPLASDLTIEELTKNA